ncbi:family 78 glycoside hydrolase catalytic domain [Chitinophaga sp.]|uniref:alpha-L-rhamnosidase n=1 Tax=Chitinophaga sp. TaxID=1869181 RepID=UPI0031D661A4
MRLTHLFPFMLCLSCFCKTIYAQTPQLTVANLRTEYTIEPLGIDIPHPRFSWQMNADKPNTSQSFYSIEVSTDRGDIVWQSGKVKSGISLNIAYNGAPLKPRTIYQWKVKVWNQDGIAAMGKSRFETGLMDTRISAWEKARWIGGDDQDLVLYAQYLPVFKLNCSIQLDEASHSTHAGLIWGANDMRLLDKNKNNFNIQSPKDSSYIKIELDISPLTSGSPASLHVFRTGYQPGEKSGIPLKTFTVPLSLINQANCYLPHQLHVSSVMGDTRLYIDGEAAKNLVGRIGLNPLGQGGDFIAFPVLADIGFSVGKQEKALFSHLQVRHYRSPSNIIYECYKAPFLLNSQAAAAVHLISPENKAMPLLRTKFDLQPGKVAKARLYITARGIYEAYINGHHLGNDYFNPGLTQYTKTQMYQTFDVTNYVSAGENAMGVVLGEGWWSGGSTYMGDFWNFFGDRQSLLAKLVITYADGHENTVVTDPVTWKIYNKGPWLYGSMFQGEVYDATRENVIRNWTLASYKDTAWKKAAEVPLQHNISIDTVNKLYGMPAVDDYSQLAIIGQTGETVRKIDRLTARSMEEVRPGVFVYDMGQNIAGVPHIRLSGQEAGSKVILRYAEVRYPNLPAYKDHAGMMMLENIRAAMAQDIYVSHGGEEIIAPRFTYHGFRYIEITGIKHPLPLSAVCADVLSSVHQFSSSFETSNPLVNRLWQNIRWSTAANFMSIPTDCPQRNERLGWSGDISVFARTATYLTNVPQFLRKHMLAMRDVQRADGRFSDVAPLGGGFGDALWGSAGITVAWESYLQYGDEALLQEHYPAMKSYIEFLLRQIDPKTGVLDEKNRNNWSSLGDWLSPEYDKTEKTLLWESYLVYDLEILGKMAVALNKSDDAQRFGQLLAERKAFFNRNYLDAKTGVTAFRGKIVDTQTSYALPVAFQIIDQDKKQLADSLLNNAVQRKNTGDDHRLYPGYSLMTGFIGTAWVSKALSQGGHQETAYRQLQDTLYPSWLYPVTQGATTIWERLNSYTHDQGFGGNNNMNSFNHYSFGAVGAWMYENVLGIQRDEDSPGFKHFIIAPEPDPSGTMKFAKGYYDSMYGRISVSWRADKNTCCYAIQIPANTTASVLIIAGSPSQIAGNSGVATSLLMKYYKGANKGRLQFELPSGNYVINVKK